MDQKFFRIPFALSGDVATIPDDTQPDGSVSYTQGYTFDYERELGVDPDAKPVPRDQSNYLYFAITDAIGYMQKWGAAGFITSADNDGVPFEYGLGATVVFAFSGGGAPKKYVSLVAANTSSPESDPSKWQLLSASGATAFATGAEVTAGTVSDKAIAPDVAKVKFAYLAGAAFTGAVSGPSFTTPSDMRLKDNVRPYDGPSGELSLMSWTWNEDAPGDLPGTEDSGVIAQDVQRAYPSCVYEDKNGILHVNYAKLAVHMLLTRGR